MQLDCLARAVSPGIASSRSWRLVGSVLLAVLVGATLGSSSASVRSNDAARVVSSSVAPQGESSPVAMTGYRWDGRTQIAVYSSWDGGACSLDGVSYGGPASTSVSATVAAGILQASIDDINTQLRGSLALVNAGALPRSRLCAKSDADPIVIGWGALRETGRALSYGIIGTGGTASFSFARVFISNTFEFNCAAGPVYRDLQHTVTHELLHAIGIGHSDNPTAVMAPVSTACDSPYLLQPEDVAGLASLYPAASTQRDTATSALASRATLSDVRFGASRSALAVFSGGSVEQLAGAIAASGASGAWVQDARGRFLLVVAGGPAFLRDAVAAAYPAGIPASTPVTAVR